MHPSKNQKWKICPSKCITNNNIPATSSHKALGSLESAEWPRPTS